MKDRNRGKERGNRHRAGREDARDSGEEIKGKTEASYSPESQLAAPPLPCHSLLTLRPRLKFKTVWLFQKNCGLCICCKERKTIWVEKAT